MMLGKQNTIHNPLVDRDKINIKFGIMNQFIKSLDRNGNCFSYICRTFAQLSMEKIFDGSEIKNLTKDTKFTDWMTEIESNTWIAFVSMMQNILGNPKSENYIELVDDLLLQLKNMGCNMSIKLHLLCNRFVHLQRIILLQVYYYHLNLRLSKTTTSQLHQSIFHLEMSKKAILKTPTFAKSWSLAANSFSRRGIKRENTAVFLIDVSLLYSKIVEK